MCYSILRTKYRKTMTGANPEFTECESPEDEARKIEERQQRPEAVKVEVFRNVSAHNRREIWDHVPFVAKAKESTEESK